MRGRWQFQSLSWISDLFVRKPWFQLSGGGLVEDDLRIADGQFDTGSTLDVPHADAVANVMGNRVSGAAQAHGQIVDAPAGRRAQLQVAMQAFDVAPADAPKQAFVKGRDLRLEMGGDARLHRLRETLQARLRFKDAQVPDVTTYNRYLPRSVRLLGGGGSFDGDLRLDASGEVGTGSVALRGRAVQLALAGVGMRGDADLDVRVRRADLERHVFDLDGSRLALRRMQLTSDGDTRGDWWATLYVGRGRISGNTPFQVDADATIRMRDARLVLSLFSRRADYPKWIFNLVDAGAVEASGKVRWRRDGVVVDDLEASNQRLTMRARMSIGDDRRRGALYLRWGMLGLGVQLQDDMRQWHLANAREWYEAQPPLLR